jgi:hypothetical protein
MSNSIFKHTYSIYGKTMRFLGGGVLTQIFLTALLGSFQLIVPAQASESTIEIVGTWVEDGYLFHVEFEAEPANANCSLNGEGLIEFEVMYDAQTSSGVESVFGLATWYPGSDAEVLIETQGRAIGPQALCTTFTPCRIQAVHVVQTHCPVTNGPLFYN